MWWYYPSNISRTGIIWYEIWCKTRPTSSYGLVSVTLSTCKRSHGHKQPMGNTGDGAGSHTKSEPMWWVRRLEAEPRKRQTNQIKKKKKKAVLTCSHWVRYCHSDKSHYGSPFLLTCGRGKKQSSQSQNHTLRAVSRCQRPITDTRRVNPMCTLLPKLCGGGSGGCFLNCEWKKLPFFFFWGVAICNYIIWVNSSRNNSAAT